MEIKQASKDKIQMLIERWGIPLQLLITMEQCSQLSTECSHWLRWERDKNRVIERMADMQIMIETLQQVFDVKDNDLQTVIDYKLAEALKKE